MIFPLDLCSDFRFPDIMHRCLESDIRKGAKEGTVGSLFRQWWQTGDAQIGETEGREGNRGFCKKKPVPVPLILS